VALTQRGNIAVYVRHVNDGFAPILKTYSTVEEAGAEGTPEDILATAAAKISDDYVQKLDISKRLATSRGYPSGCPGPLS
jgi:hypothetical protein